MIGKDELQRSNPLNSLPMNLALQPSVISVNEGGTGLGYSKMMGYDISSSLALSFHVHNLFNRMYYADAWIWRAYFKESDSYYCDTGIYPQAPLNWTVKVAWKF